MSSGKVDNEQKIRFCGLGGMGIILVSVILGKAAIYDGKNALQTQSYGAEQRGTKVKSDVIISDSNSILCPIIDKIDILIALSQEAFDFYLPDVKKNGLIFINSDLIDVNENETYVKIPATSLARKLDNEKVSNIIILGALIKKTNLVSSNSIIQSINNTITKNNREINIKAFETGYNFS
ncbi:MAG: 2-oxoacid:acceptor oxidoreductase family protein [Candidatus Helarchaeota archaeon]